MYFAVHFSPALWAGTGHPVCGFVVQPASLGVWRGYFHCRQHGLNISEVFQA